MRTFVPMYNQPLLEEIFLKQLGQKAQSACENKLYTQLHIRYFMACSNVPIWLVLQVLSIWLGETMH